MGTISRATGAPYADGETLGGVELEADFNTIYNEFNGNVDTANLKDGGVTTAKLAANAVTQAKLATTAASASEAQVEISGIGYAFGTSYANVGTAVSHTVGNPARHVVIFASFMVATSNDPTSINVKLLKDGANLQAAFFTDQHDILTVTGTAFQLVSRMYIDTAPTPGATHVYQLQMKTTSGAAGADNLNLFAFEPRS